MSPSLIAHYSHYAVFVSVSLLVELTNPLLTDEVYEYALNHDVRVWLQYLRLLSHRVKSSPSLQRVKVSERGGGGGRGGDT